MEETRREESAGDEPDGGYEINLDDTASNLDAVIQEAMASVDRAKEDPGEEADLDIEEEARDDAPTADEAADEAPTGQEIRRLQGENEALRDRLLRLQADFDNFRKRTEREKSDLRRFAQREVLKDFLEVVDNLGRAHAASGGSADDVKQGVAMILRQLETLLGRYGVQALEAIGQPFDPTFHEAVGREESSEVEQPTVTAELQRGYVLHDRLLRPAMVQVAMPAPKPSKVEEPDDAADTDDAANKDHREAATR